MTKWTKKAVSKSQISPLCGKYGMSQLLASIFVRRGITGGEDILYYLESDLRFQHSPFLLNSMEDAADRILSAVDENERILIFGDSDVDGITSTAILFEQLKSMGADVEWRLPLADDAYGLSVQAVDDFAARNGTLIITVDCGISNFDEIAHASSLGIDVIVTDHHNPPDTLPEALVIVNPKIPGSAYPFQDISGAAVAFKLVSALRFTSDPLYKSEICLMYAEQREDGGYSVDCIKVRNMIRRSSLHEEAGPEGKSISSTRLPEFLAGQVIYVWDKKHTASLLRGIFGEGIEFSLYDLRDALSSLNPAFRDKTIGAVMSRSSLAKYSCRDMTAADCMYNLFVTCSELTGRTRNRKTAEAEMRDLQLVALAALADIMPMKNENRVFVRAGIKSIKQDGPRPGLAELFSRMRMSAENIGSTDLSWTVIPALNAAGRMGQSDLSLQLLISGDPKEREMLADNIVRLNEERKELVSSAEFKIRFDAQKSVDAHGGKLCVVIDDGINKGVTGILASKLMQTFGIPALAATYCDDICVGSVRSCRGFVATDFLDRFGDFFINHGGHDCAAGFSFRKDRTDEFLRRIDSMIPSIELSDEEPEAELDAEIPAGYLTPEIISLTDTFEPYGSGNPELVFVSRNLPLCDALAVGKKNPQHLKLTFDCGKYKFPAMLWGGGDRLGKDIRTGGSYDIIYSLSRNFYNGITTPQIIIKEINPHRAGT